MDILRYQGELLLVAGLLMMFLGTMPMISNRWFNEMNEKFWKSKIKLMSTNEQYLYNRYFRNSWWVLFGFVLTVYALRKLFF